MVMAEQNCPDISRFEELLAGNVSEAEQEELGKHIEQCDDCRRRLEELAGDVSVVSDNVGDAGQPAADAPQRDGAIEKLLAEGPDQTITSASDESGERDFSLDFLDPTDHPDHLGRLGPYEIAGVIGRGGMGVVLRAMDSRLDRSVAIKVLHGHLLSDGVARKRFLREAKAAAAVTDDHVVTIHAVEEAKGIPFLVMEYVVGVSLDERIKRDGTLKLEEILRIGMQTASGLSAAHAQGLVHRDIKPSNILLENGVERVQITDFGLARIVHDAQITQSNVVAGTPEFMSPEQAQGDPLDHRSDLFSLGCLLYAMCTGRSPFRGSSTIHAIRRVCDDTPRPIQEVNREIPDWLVGIIDRLLAKKADDRFQSASEVAELLGDHLAHLQRPAEVPLPQPSRPAAPQEPRTAGRRRWRRAALWASAISILVLISAGVIVPRLPGWRTPASGDGDGIDPVEFGTVRVSGDRKGIVVITGKKDKKTIPPGKGEEVVLRPDRYRVDLFFPGETTPFRTGWITVVPGGDLYLIAGSGVNFHPVPGPQRIPVAEVHGHKRRGSPGDGILAVAYSPNGTVFATGGKDKTVRLWKLVDGVWQEWRSLEGHSDSVRTIAFSPDGKILVSAGDDRTIRLWDVATGTQKDTLTRHEGSVRAVAFSTDGRLLASGSDDDTVILWDCKTWLPIKTFAAFGADVRSVAFSPDAKTLATAVADGSVRLWDVATGEERLNMRGHTSAVTSVAFSPDGKKLASGSSDMTIRIWDVTTGRVLRTFGLDSPYNGSPSVAFSPDGKLLAIACGQVVRLWDVNSGGLRDEFFAHWGYHLTAAFSPDGKYLLTGSGDRTARIWEVAQEGAKPSRPHPETRFQDNMKSTFAFSPIGNVFAVGAGTRAVRVWDLAEAKELAKFTAQNHVTSRALTGTTCLAFLPDGKTLTTCGFDKTLRLWDAESGESRATISHTHAFWRLAVSPDGKTIATLQFTANAKDWNDCDQTLTLWDVESRTSRSIQSWHGPLCSVAFSPDGRLLACGTTTGYVIVWDATTGEESKTVLGHGDDMILGLGFSPDGTALASANRSTIKLWDVTDWTVSASLKSTVRSTMSLAYSPDGKLLATAGGDMIAMTPQTTDQRAKVELWDTTTGRLLTEFAGHVLPVQRIAFSPDGKKLATAGMDAKTNLWDVAELLQAGATPTEESPSSDTDDKSPE